MQMKQLELKKVKGWGGKRRGAGRPNLSGMVGHAKRPEVDFKKPLHLTLKLNKGLPTLRTRQMTKAFRKAADHARKFGLNVIHFALLKDHLHLIAEARDNQ